MWTRFMDMHSGGGAKQKPYEYIYIEAPEDRAIKVFYERFGHDPRWVACDCCGENYSISEHDTLEEATQDDKNDGEFLVISAEGLPELAKVYEEIPTGRKLRIEE